jgi:HPt (histidine-containing phosphotransfer) domain-containing protein
VAARLAYPARVLEEKLAALREGYLRTTLPHQLGTLRALLADAQAGAPALAEAARLAHRVKGTAGSYGFASLAAELEAVEAILERARAGGALGQADRAALEGALARAEASLGPAREPGPV